MINADRRWVPAKEWITKMSINQRKIFSIFFHSIYKSFSEESVLFKAVNSGTRQLNPILRSKEYLKFIFIESFPSICQFIAVHGESLTSLYTKPSTMLNWNLVWSIWLVVVSSRRNRSNIIQSTYFPKDSITMSSLIDFSNSLHRNEALEWYSNWSSLVFFFFERSHCIG